MENRKPDYIDEDGNQIWYDKDIRLHNDIGYPAKIWTDGSKFWYKHGHFHNDFGPAVIYEWGTKFWYQNGKRHNENGPARIWPGEDKEWYIDDVELTEEEFKQHKIKQFIDGK